MPVKAKPVEYVKICTLYGAGFYYIPGTDICIKWGAYVRAQWYFNAGAAPTNGPFVGVSGQAADFLNQPNDLVYRTRAIWTMDARTQTEYGTLRAYTLIGYTHESPGNAVGGQGPTLYATRGFLQFAGFTIGKATSFYDIWSVPANSYFAVWSSDTGDGGDMVVAYTFQFGNGFSGTLSLEDPRRNSIINTSLGLGGAPALNGNGTFGAGPTTRTDFTLPFLVGTNASTDSANMKWPDIVANLRVDQAWGSFQVMGALHDNSGGFWTAQGGSNNCFGGLVPAATGLNPSSTLNGSLACGGPDDNLGFAVGVGGIFKVPMPTGLTDVASFQVNYSEGASRYVVFTQPGGGSPNYFTSPGTAFCPTLFDPRACAGQLGLGYWSDGIFANPGALPGYNGQVQNTKAWGVNAAWDHLWTPNLKTSVYGAFIHFDYNGTATALIGTNLCGVAPPFGTGIMPVAAGNVRMPSNGAGNFTNCDPDFSVWMVGSRTQWNITPSFYVGFDVMYQKLETAFAGFGNYAASAVRPGGSPAGVVGSSYQIADQDTVSFTARAHWDILP